MGRTAVADETRGWSEARILGLLRRAARTIDGPLSVSKFQAWGRKNQVPLPSVLTIINRFGSWREACSAAGLSTNKPRFQNDSPSMRVSEADCRLAVRSFIDICAGSGVKPTAERYRSMSAKKGWPSFGTLGYRLHQPWSMIVSTRGGSSTPRRSRQILSA